MLAPSFHALEGLGTKQDAMVDTGKEPTKAAELQRQMSQNWDGNLPKSNPGEV